MTGNNYISITPKGIEASLEVYIYKNDGCEIAYSPALDILGYGKTMKEAMDSFRIVIADFFESGIKRGTLDKYLISKKWVKEQKEPVFNSPQVAALVKDNNRFQSILSAPQLRKKTIPYRHALS